MVTYSLPLVRITNVIFIVKIPLIIQTLLHQTNINHQLMIHICSYSIFHKIFNCRLLKTYLVNFCFFLCI